MTTKTMSPKVEQRFLTNASATRRPLVDNMLVESEGFTQMTILEEDSKNSGSLIIEGLVGRCGVATANKRFYGESIMRREVERLQERINSRSLLAAVDHPTDGKSRIREAGAICIGLRVESDGSVIGKYTTSSAKTSSFTDSISLPILPAGMLIRRSSRKMSIRLMSTRTTFAPPSDRSLSRSKIVPVKLVLRLLKRKFGSALRKSSSWVSTRLVRSFVKTSSFRLRLRFASSFARISPSSS